MTDDHPQFDNAEDMQEYVEDLKVRVASVPECHHSRLGGLIVTIGVIAVAVVLGATWGTAPGWASGGIAVLLLFLGSVQDGITHRTWHAGAAHAMVGAFERTAALMKLLADAMKEEEDNG